MTAVILAGGLGTRMGDICKDTPKPLIEVNGKPVLQHQIETLSGEGIKDFVLVIGHMSDKVLEYFGDGSKFGVNITYFQEEKPLGTAGALFKLAIHDDFLLCNGDLVFDFSLSSMLAYHKEKNALATLFCHPNSHPHDSTLVITDTNNRVTNFLSPINRTDYYANLCNAGIQIISPKLLKLFDISGKASLDKDILLPAIKTERIFAYKSHEYVHDMGTPARLSQAEADVNSGIVSAMHRNNKQKAVFLDRDGTVNIHRGFITDPSEIELIPHAAEAISTFNRSGYLSILITNQPIIARGDCTTEQLKVIHNKLEYLLGEKGAYLDAIYYCPHHPDKGYENEVPELKIECNCRKPSPGLLLQAAKDFNIDLSQSYMVGDSERDVLAAKNAGCIPVLLTENSVTGDSSVQTYGSLGEFAEALKVK